MANKEGFTTDQELRAEIVHLIKRIKAATVRIKTFDELKDSDWARQLEQETIPLSSRHLGGTKDLIAKMNYLKGIVRAVELLIGYE